MEEVTSEIENQRKVIRQILPQNEGYNQILMENHGQELMAPYEELYARYPAQNGVARTLENLVHISDGIKKLRFRPLNYQDIMRIKEQIRQFSLVKEAEEVQIAPSGPEPR